METIELWHAERIHLPLCFASHNELRFEQAVIDLAGLPRREGGELHDNLRLLWIEADDFAEVPPPRFFRLSPGREVRLRGAYLITATDVVKDGDGTVIQVNATYDRASRGGTAPDGRKVKSTMHWVSAAHAVSGSVALYDRLFSAAVPGERTGEPLDDLNPASLELLTDCWLEGSLAEVAPATVVQFERLGYFAHDGEQPLLFHRTVGLRDEWAAVQKRQGK
jgi:glutaminyl-tRNA synthetase